MKKTNLKLCALFCAFGALSCGFHKIKQIDVSPSGEVLFDVSKEQKFPDVGITLKRLRVWKSSPADRAPGAIPFVERHVAELWFTLQGETITRYARLGDDAGLEVDAAGNLFLPDYPVGRVVSSTEMALSSVRDEPQSYTVVAKDAFLTWNGPIVIEKASDTVVEGGVSVSKDIRYNLSDIAEKPWGDYRLYGTELPPIAQRTRLEDNSKFTLKGKLGCITRTQDASGNTEAPVYLWEDVELGSYIANPGGVLTTPGGSARPAAFEDKDADDDALMVLWNEIWRPTGLNIKTKTLRFVRIATTNMYTGRELPQVDRSNNLDQVSGFEKLLMKCNARLGQFATTTNAEFEIFDPRGRTSKTMDYCPSFVSATATDHHALNSNACPFLGSAGTWNGNAHTEAVTAGADSFLATYEHFSTIQEAQF